MIVIVSILAVMEPQLPGYYNSLIQIFLKAVGLPCCCN